MVRYSKLLLLGKFTNSLLECQRTNHSFGVKTTYNQKGHIGNLGFWVEATNKNLILS